MSQLGYGAYFVARTQQSVVYKKESYRCENYDADCFRIMINLYVGLQFMCISAVLQYNSMPDNPKKSKIC